MTSRRGVHTCNDLRRRFITLLGKNRTILMHEITDLLKAWSSGDTQALEKLVPLVDDELRKIAHNYMRNERSGHILQTTALVNEALIKLIRENISWENRKQFYALVAKRMRQVLVDYARRTQRADYVDVDEAVIPDETPKEVLLLDEALTKLAGIDERKETIVECRYFIGLTLAEIAELLGVGQSTVEREWRFARSWLKREMTE
jgi:RNA polymerase sigma-70 factor (ECF subfamily)